MKKNARKARLNARLKNVPLTHATHFRPVPILCQVRINVQERITKSVSDDLDIL